MSRRPESNEAGTGGDHLPVAAFAGVSGIFLVIDEPRKSDVILAPWTDGGDDPARLSKKGPEPRKEIDACRYPRYDQPKLFLSVRGVRACLVA